MSIDLEALTDVVEAEVYADNHKELCGCDGWPDACRTFPNGALFSVTTYGVLEAALPHIEEALVKRILADALGDLDDDSNPFSAALKARTKRVREQIARDLHNCRDCGKPHVYRDLPPNGPWLRGTWGDPDDGHAYRPWISNGDHVAAAAAIARGEVPR